MPTLEEIRQRFAADRYACETTGVEILEARPGEAVCRLAVEERHLNANGVPQGGAIFTLADFAFAIAVNGHAQEITVSQQMGITFLAAAKGKVLTATARCLKAGRRTCLYQVDVTDELGTFVAFATVHGFTVGKFEKRGPEG